MKTFVTGANGQVGRELVKRGVRQGLEIYAVDIEELDITDKKAVENVVVHSNISLVINAAAYTAVDKAETEPDSAFAVNRDGPSHLAFASLKKDIPLIHISTDYVFDGTKEKPYIETDEVAPLGVYGRSKEAGEAKVRAVLQKHIILRTAWLYSAHGQNFVKTMLSLGHDRQEIKVVDDQFGCPTFAGDLADAILLIANHIRKRHNIPWGTYHYCGRGITSWYRFAKVIFEIAGQYQPLEVKNVLPVSASEYPSKAKRPANSALDCSKIVKAFGVRHPLWEHSIKDMLRGVFTSK